MMKSRAICKRCHRLKIIGIDGYCGDCRDALDDVSVGRRRPTVPAPPLDAEETARQLATGLAATAPAPAVAEPMLEEPPKIPPFLFGGLLNHRRRPAAPTPEPEPPTSPEHPIPEPPAPEELEGPAINYTTERAKPAEELRASDVPRGVDVDDLAAPAIVPCRHPQSTHESAGEAELPLGARRCLDCGAVFHACELCIDPIDKPFITEGGGKIWRACQRPATKVVTGDSGRLLRICEVHAAERTA